ncbi:hypothetical protein [Amycolatopsis lexingtonensis]|uniref:hypothetical protein n=1 Tax=Amycolatopsis lexingtonensis TaxID=218822 RepID=UPI003F729D83
MHRSKGHLSEVEYGLKAQLVRLCDNAVGIGGELIRLTEEAATRQAFDVTSADAAGSSPSSPAG